MKKLFTKREFLATSVGGGIGLGAGLVLGSGQEAAFAQTAMRADGPRGVGSDVRRRRVTTTPLFKAPFDHPNGLEADPDGAGIWIAQQKLSADVAAGYGLPPWDDPSEAASLVDWNGNLLRTVMTDSRNTSGMAVGGGYVWMVANAAPFGVFQTDMDSRLVSHRQTPLGGGGNHGATYRDGKLWLVSTRMRAIVRVDPSTWEAEYLLPLNSWDRLHDMAIDDEGTVWVVVGTRYGDRIEDARPGLARYDVSGGGRLLEYAEFPDVVPDPHGLTFHDGVLYACDAGIHPGWPGNYSEFSGYIFRIDLA
jgi:hypothetical protein